MAEENLRRALQASAGNWSVFVTRPISLAFLLIAAFSVLMTFRKQMKQKALRLRKKNNRQTASEDIYFINKSRHIVRLENGMPVFLFNVCYPNLST